MAKEYQSVQALRGVACLAVVLFHVNNYDLAYFGYVSYHPLRPVVNFGYAGVDLFFVLSGFIIATTNRSNLGRPAAVPRFLFRRAWRIYPTFWAALIPATLYMVNTNPDFFRVNESRVFFHTLSLLPLLQGFDLLPAAWSLSFELMFYLAFSLLFLLPRRAGPWFLGVWAVVVVTYAIITDGQPANIYTRHVLCPFVLEFLMGCAVAWLPAWPQGRWAAAVATLALVWAATWMAFTPNCTGDVLGLQFPRRVTIFGVAVALFLLAAVGYERGGGRVALPRLVAAGNASYSIYLTHLLVIKVLYDTNVRAHWEHTQLFWHFAWLAGLFAAVVWFGLAFHRTVEQPLLALAKSKKPRPAAEPTGWLIPIAPMVRHG
jgi:peptidoglycan/LPS O-acetylase OafA/YrhL